jgi:hypothetical protein
MARTKQSARPSSRAPPSSFGGRGGGGFGSPFGFGQFGSSDGVAPAAPRHFPTSAVTHVRGDDLDSLSKDITGEDSDEEGKAPTDGQYTPADDQDGDQQGKKKEDAAFMFFDFRRGREKWPKNATYLDPKQGEELIEQAIRQAEEESSKKKGDDGKTDDGSSQTRIVTT